MPTNIQQTFRELGGAATFGRELGSELDIAQAVSDGLPLTALRALTLAGFSKCEIARYVIRPQTRSRRAAHDCSLTPAESDRVMRLLRMQELALDTFGDLDKAFSWLRRPLMAPDGEIPLGLSRTEVGARVIETILGKIAMGAAA
ncbi:antitoxin Xre/MbcA/ParS toxin-binding domain-containing protein [Aquibaculum sediminis]|uniref:antitoxin Xre/MbcA/ParS toxin-binding domain-containing protein n=1 Tax=Aquibaculum sediminis TaxID=3231907 RepID=UPI0034526BF9